ncbi:hypothetical protein [Kitasatospora sp. NBC_01539]|uniref:hypothetical protein n=1 Tax=Kitasatospora sp. NBC_01539 TaxID=2903577 RepID=UPI0038602BB1
MDAATSALAVAGIGIIGTLTSGVLIQMGSRKTRMRELEHADRQKDADRSHASKVSDFEARRSSYISLNSAARHYQTELANYLHAQRGGVSVHEAREAVEEARQIHRARYAEAQMMFQDEILRHASAVNRHLGDTYGILRRIEAGRATEAENFELAQNMRVRGWEIIAAMRAAMRVDLGVSANP